MLCQCFKNLEKSAFEVPKYFIWSRTVRNQRCNYLNHPVELMYVNVFIVFDNKGLRLPVDVAADVAALRADFSL